MAGIEIPIGGDMAPFIAVAASLKAEMQNLAASVRSALRPTKTDSQSAVVAIKAIWKSTEGASMRFRLMKTAIGAAGLAFKGLGNAASSVFSGIAAGAKSAIRSLSGIGASIKSAIPGGGMLGPLLGIAGIAGSVALLVSQFKSGAEVAGNIEQTSIALEALTGSGDTAKKVLDEMRATWIRTGATIEQQGTSIRKFIALGFSPEDALKLQSNLLDVAGAVGMTADQSELLASALAQVKAKGVVSMEELRQQIAEKGIPVFEALAGKMGVTQAALIKMVSDGKVPAQELLDIFLNMEGSFGKFVGGANRMGMTFFGLISRLKGAWQLLMAEFAAPVIDSIKPILTRAIDLVGTFKAAAANAGKAVGDALLSVFALIKRGKSFEFLGAGFKVAVAGAMDLLMRGVRAATAFLATALPPIFQAAFAKLSDPNFWNGVSLLLKSAALGFTAEIKDAIGKKSEAAGLRTISDVVGGIGSRAIAGAGNVDMGKVMVEAFRKGGEEAAKAFGGPSSTAFVLAMDNFKKLFSGVSKDVAKMRAGSAIPPATPGAPSTPATNALETTVGALKSAMTLTTSLARVGGGGFGMTFSPMITEQKKANSLLQKIAANTGRPGAPAIA